MNNVTIIQISLKQAAIKPCTLKIRTASLSKCIPITVQDLIYPLGPWYYSRSRWNHCLTTVVIVKNGRSTEQTCLAGANRGPASGESGRPAGCCACAPEQAAAGSFAEAEPRGGPDCGSAAASDIAIRVGHPFVSPRPEFFSVISPDFVINRHFRVFLGWRHRCPEIKQAPLWRLLRRAGSCTPDTAPGTSPCPEGHSQLRSAARQERLVPVTEPLLFIASAHWLNAKVQSFLSFFIIIKVGHAHFNRWKIIKRKVIN